MTIADYLTDLKAQQKGLADNLTTMGVQASETELLNTLVPKVLEISSGMSPSPPINPFIPVITWLYLNNDFEWETIQTNVTIGGTAVPPNIPTTIPAKGRFPGLTMQEWNYTSTEMQNVTGDMCIGATYITSDGYSYFLLTANANTGTSFTFNYYKTEAGALEWRVLDANGTSLSYGYPNDSAGASLVTFYVPSAGDYVLRVKRFSGSFQYGIGGSTTATTVIGASSQPQRNALTHAFIGSDVSDLKTYAFNSCYSLRICTVPSGTQFLAGVFNNCAANRALVVPRGAALGDNMFGGNYVLSYLSIPGSAIGDLGASTLYNCYNLRVVCIPEGIVTVGGSSIQGCHAAGSIWIPSTVTSIGTIAFNGLSGKREFIFKPTIPPTLANMNVFTSINTISKIYVPDASLSAYTSGTNWSSFKTYIFPMSSRGT